MSGGVCLQVQLFIMIHIRLLSRRLWATSSEYFDDAFWVVNSGTSFWARAAFATNLYFFTKNCRQQSRQQVARSCAVRKGTQVSKQLRVKDPAAHGVVRSHVADGSARQVAVAASSRGRLAAATVRQSASNRKAVVVMVAR